MEDIYPADINDKGQIVGLAIELISDESISHDTSHRTSRTYACRTNDWEVEQSMSIPLSA